jgi:hypothetical protein
VAEETSGSSAASGGGDPVVRNRFRPGSTAVRSVIATLVWVLAVLAALVLSVGALLIALKANPDDAMVGGVLDWADRIDWFFWKVFELKDRTANHLVNWGLAAVCYLAAGRIADGIIRP